MAERVHGKWQSFSFVVGTVVGTGVYLKSSTLANYLGSREEVCLIWLLGGMYAFCGAMVYSKLAARWPENGGPYVYLKETYGSWASSLLLAADVFIARPAAVGALATGFGLIWGLGHLECLYLGVLLLAFLTWVQLLGARFQGQGQLYLTILQLLPLCAVLGFGIAQGGGEAPEPISQPAQVRWASAFLAVLWAYDGWYNITILAGEVKLPRKQIQQALLGGLGFVMVLYISLNLLLWSQLTPHQIAASPVPFAALFQKWNWSWLGLATQLALSLALLATLQGTLACGSRMMVAAAEDGLLPSSLKTAATAKLPTGLFALQCLAILFVFGGLDSEQSLFDTLSELTAVVVMGLSALTVSCVFHSQNFRDPRGLLTLLAALFYLLVSFAVGLRLLGEDGSQGLYGLALVGGVGTLLWFRRLK